MPRLIRFGIWLLGTLALAGPAAALTVGVFGNSAGLDQGFGRVGITNVYSLSAATSASASSTITFANNLSLATEVVTVSIVGVSPIFTGGGNNVAFSNMTYTATTNATVTALAGGRFLVQRSGLPTGNVSGSYTATLGGSGPLNLTTSLSALSCNVDAAGVGVCGISFGTTGFTVNDGAQNVNFQHTFNLNIPEPAAWLLLATGVAGLAFASARTRRVS